LDFDFSDEQTLLRDSVRKMMDRVATSDYVRHLDREQKYPDELYEAWVEMGLLGLPFPEEFGGAGGNVMDMVVVADEISRKSFDLYTAYSSSIFCGLNVLQHGSKTQREAWLPKLLSGEIKMSISMSEPDAGSDIGAMQTTAVRDGEHWVINGRKIWATGAGAKNNVINVYVKTAPAADYRQGMSLFLVPNDTPGLQLRKLEMLGRRCTGTFEITFDNVRVPAAHLIGGENNGWQVVLGGLQIERITSAAGYCGAGQAALDMALQYAKDRKQFGRSIGTFQALAHMIADVQTELEAAKTLVWRAASACARKTPDALKLISMAKLFASETYVKVSNVGMQVLGGAGYSMEFDLQRHFRDARSTTIGAGTSQMQRNLIANLMGLKVK
jgi:alkylation response protein AidB-like acyl-CoA dehydrogenase